MEHYRPGACNSANRGRGDGPCCIPASKNSSQAKALDPSTHASPVLDAVGQGARLGDTSRPEGATDVLSGLQDGELQSPYGNPGSAG